MTEFGADLGSAILPRDSAPLVTPPTPSFMDHLSYLEFMDHMEESLIVTNLNDEKEWAWERNIMWDVQMWEIKDSKGKIKKENLSRVNADVDMEKLKHMKLASTLSSNSPTTWLR